MSDNSLLDNRITKSTVELKDTIIHILSIKFNINNH
jgi:flagellar basal body-associated protein FliL